MKDKTFFLSLFDNLKKENKEQMEGVFIKNKIINKFNLTKYSDESNLTFNLNLFIELITIHNYKSIYIAHNHPNGLCFPSPEDIKLTSNLLKVCKENHVILRDHFIITDKHYYSMKDMDWCKHGIIKL